MSTAPTKLRKALASSTPYQHSLTQIHHLCGDFSTAVDAPLDQFGCNPLSSWAYNWPTSHDACRLQHPATKESTWRRPNGTQGSRLDMFWLSAFLLPFILQVDILPFFRSDHAYVYLKLALPTSVHRGRGLWKFNVTHLSNDAFAQMEFYQRFWPLLGKDYVEVMNFCFANQKLTPTQRSGVITLLHNRGDVLDMKNWRPITLLCVDYKIAAKALANRLLLVLPFVINTNQSCGVPGRNPSENCRLLKDLILDANTHGTGGAVLSLDQEKGV